MLWLRFFVMIGGLTRFVNSPALLNSVGLYEDAIYVYTEEGKFLKRNVRNLEAIWEEVQQSRENLVE